MAAIVDDKAFHFGFSVAWDICIQDSKHSFGHMYGCMQENSISRNGILSIYVQRKTGNSKVESNGVKVTGQ